MSVKFSNNGHSTLAASITSSGTSVTVASGHGARFPSLSSGEYFYATLIDASNNLEIVKVTARSSDVLTVTRAQESTTARAFAIGDRIELRVTAQGLADHIDLDNVVADNSITAAKINISGNGTAGQAVLTDGDGSFSYGDAGGGLQSQQVFSTAGGHTYTKPSGINFIKVYVTGGGGGAGDCPGDNSNDMGQAGAAGGTAIELIDVSSLSSTVSVTVGAGGSGGGNGGHGGTSSFGSYCSATGGDGSPNTTNYIAVIGGVGSGGDINLQGQGPAGNAAINYNGGGTQAIGGGGGNSFFGGGGSGGRSGSAATAGTTGGGGGAGANTPGAAGGVGIVVVEEYK
jgi:ribosomal protein L18